VCEGSECVRGVSEEGIKGTLHFKHPMALGVKEGQG
jgi:hypothetical protein